MYQKRLSTLSVAMGLISTLSAVPVTAGVYEYDWNGFLTILDEQGAAIGNFISKTENYFNTHVSGTMAFDEFSGAGTATLAPFTLLNGTSPAESTSMKLQAIGNGMGGDGSLILGNMLFNWNGNVGIPGSVVLDATGLFTGMNNGDFYDDGVLNRTDVAGYGAIPASDGTYVGTFSPDTDTGYLNIGPVPIATTEWDTTNINGCVFEDCYGNDTSGGFPLVTDLAANLNEYAQGDGLGIGGSPMQDGPFLGKSYNFDFTELVITGYGENQYIESGCAFEAGNTCNVLSSVPVPAAVWLFGSGLLGLISIARYRKT